MPIATWQSVIETYYPNTAWLYVQRDTFERLYQYKRRHSLTTWEQAIEQLLAERVNVNGKQ